MAEFKFKNKYGIYDLVEIIRCLRAPGGCPWDAEQTHESIKKNLIEETYEAIEAINKNDKALLCEELGDVLLQVVLHAQMESEQGVFDIDDVANGICNKLIERHPHVFGDVSVDNVEEVLSNWDDIKRRSKGQERGSSPMKSVPREFPALMRAQKIQQKAAIAGFDWAEVEGALEKLEEEIAELKVEIKHNRSKAANEELGDVLFSAVNVARFIKADAEESLTLASDKFLSRFEQVEKLAENEGLTLTELPLSELDRLWEKAKLSPENY